MAVHARKDELRRWLKARGLKTTDRKQDLIDRVINAKVDGTETIEERETREKNVRETRDAEKLRRPSENLSDPKTLNNWTKRTICRNCHRLVIKNRANSSKAGKI